LLSGSFRHLFFFIYFALKPDFVKIFHRKNKNWQASAQKHSNSLKATIQIVALRE